MKIRMSFYGRLETYGRINKITICIIIFLRYFNVVSISEDFLLMYVDLV